MENLVTAPETLEDFVALRRRLHAWPELSGHEVKTSALVAELLAGWGYEVATGVGGTGVVGTLRVGPGARVIGLRADMDALPISEATGLEHASQVPGVMHACGHDGHTTILLAAARALATERDFSGTVRLIFQPAEETGGAVGMLEDGLFERFPVDAVFGMHNWPGVPAGDFRFISGPAMAAVDWVVITVRGKGGHGAMPHEAVDPVVVAAQLVLALQTIVSRTVDPLETAVLTVGMIHGGTMPNIIPDSVELQITVRSFSKDVQAGVRARIKALAEGVAQSFGAVAEVFHPPGFPALANDADATAFARGVAERTFGADRVGTLAPLLVSEDFAFLLEKQRGSYLFVGNGASADLHSAQYDFNDEAIGPAARYWVALVKGFLAGNEELVAGERAPT